MARAISLARVMPFGVSFFFLNLASLMQLCRYAGVHMWFLALVINHMYAHLQI
jgi:hypothetical protein